MRLRFIGTNKSMGLTFGQIYRVAVRPWGDNGVQLLAPVLCPYESDEAFWTNWALPEVDLRDLFHKIGRNLREEHISHGDPVMVISTREMQCERGWMHGSHNWSPMNSVDTMWCPGRII